MKSQRIQAEFIRKREIEQQKIKQTEDQRRYYDKYQRINSIHEHWISPSFYHESEEKRKQEAIKLEKEKQLEERKEKLRKQLEEEKKMFELELKEHKKPRLRPSNNLLESVRNTLSNAEEIKSRASLESKLYGRWRLDHEKIIKDSSNIHKAIAKASWIDRQIENQMLNEQQKQETQKLELELEKEKRKHEEYVKDCQELRDSEINQIKSLHENNIIELKLRERELNESKLTENVLKKKLEEVQKEIENIKQTNNKRRDRMQALHNFRRIKMIMRERSEAVKRDLLQDLNLLDRISFDKDFDNDEEIKYLRDKFNGQYENESQNLQNIECMYDSEAKDALRKQEDKWNEEAVLREQQLKVLMNDRVETLNDRITSEIHKQNDLKNISEIHLKAIEDCNQRLKELMSEGLNDARIMKTISLPNDKNDNNLNGIIRATESLMINGHQYELSVPKFGRKKVLWT